jgi:glucose-1-phosphate adenylyltransferase
MDLVSVHPVFNLYNRAWPIITHVPPLPPAKFVHEEPDRTGHAISSLISPGAVISGAEVRRSVFSPGVHVHSRAIVEGSIVMHNTEVGRGAIVRNAILDKNVRVPDGVIIGVDHDHDRGRGLLVTESGIVVVGKGQVVES